MTNIYNVLFLCTGNSARSFLAESILNHEGHGKLPAYCAGSHPKRQVHPAALALLGKLSYPTLKLRSKSWDEIAAPDTLPLDFVFAVCDNAAREVCPVWTGQPMTAHWGIEDPAAVEGDSQRDAFWKAWQALKRRINLFLALPLGNIDEVSLQTRLRAIGQTDERPLNAA